MVLKHRPPQQACLLTDYNFPHIPTHRSCARQCLISRGLMPFMAAPFPDGEALLEDAIIAASRMSVVRVSYLS